MTFLTNAFFLGCGATLFMDLWAFFLQKTFQVQPFNYALVGRWLAHMRQGQFCHSTILQSHATQGEGPIGWLVHYLIGILYAAAFLWWQTPAWLDVPTLMPALIFGIVTVVVPFFLMQPCLGFGIAASKTPAPLTARAKSLMSHASFGIGLYISALLYSMIF